MTSCNATWRGTWDDLSHRCELPTGHAGEAHTCRCKATSDEPDDGPIGKGRPAA